MKLLHGSPARYDISNREISILWWSEKIPKANIPIWETGFVKALARKSSSKTAYLPGMALSGSCAMPVNLLVIPENM